MDFLANAQLEHQLFDLINQSIHILKPINALQHQLVQDHLID